MNDWDRDVAIVAAKVVAMGKSGVNMNCDHEWRQLYEEALFGGVFSIGWECVVCGEYVPKDKLTPAGLPGKVLGQAKRLVGPHGSRSITSSGQSYSQQVIDESGKLKIEP